MPQQVSMKDLLEAGVHFGHQSKRWNPKMKPYIFTARNGVHVIDLAQTAPLLEEAYGVVHDLAAQGKTIIFVGTKKQARSIIREEAMRVGAMYLTERWIGGLLTNFDSIKKSLKKLETLKAQRDSGELDSYTKKEKAIIDHEIARLERQLGGIAELRGLPDALFVIDPHKEVNAVLEAKHVGLPVIAVVDTNCDPTNIDHPIPGNDDALKSIKLFVTHIANAVEEGKKQWEAKSGNREEARQSESGTSKIEEALQPEIRSDALAAEGKTAKAVPPAGAKAKRTQEEVEAIQNGEEEKQGAPVDAAQAEEALATETKPKKAPTKTKATTATTKKSTTDK